MTRAAVSPFRSPDEAYPTASNTSFRLWRQDISSRGSVTFAEALRIADRVRGSFSPCVISHRFTPMKKGRTSGASQSRVMLVPSGSSSA